MSRRASLAAACSATLLAAIPGVGQAALTPLMSAPESVVVNATTGVVQNFNTTLAHAARATFDGMLEPASVQVESFGIPCPASGPVPGCIDPGTPAPVSLFGGLATLTGAGAIQNFGSAGGLARFDTTGDVDGNGTSIGNWWETTGTFTVLLNDQTSTFSAFGFYGTDIGDFGGTLTLELLGYVNGNLTTLESIDVLNTTNNDLRFIGFWDDQQSYAGVRFLVSQDMDPNTRTDAFGFDDMVFGDLMSSGNPAPEPGTLVLVAAALLGAGAARRWRA